MASFFSGKRCSGGAVRLGLAATAIVFRLWSAEPSANPSEALTQYVHKVWQGDAGLSNSSVMAIAQTPDGYLWLGTEEGLFRFDGASFTHYDHLNTSALASNFISALCADDDGTLWIGTAGNGIVWFKKGAFERARDIPGNANDN
ncbi:MAG: hypothetical protein JO061_17590, partial [Acidobacteriaceae bacterium]|nr:hypothetical protein [Acidobacteriaceae bacterium]